jgi:hypothetical protein
MGLFILLLTIVLAPIVGIISVFALNTEPWPVGVVIFLLGGGGLLRIVYALMFQPKYGDAGALPPAVIDEQTTFGRAASQSALPPPSIIPPIDRTGSWLDTNNLEPDSVTDHTTKLLEKDS